MNFANPHLVQDVTAALHSPMNLFYHLDKKNMSLSPHHHAIFNHDLVCLYDTLRTSCI